MCLPGFLPTTSQWPAVWQTVLYANIPFLSAPPWISTPFLMLAGCQCVKENVSRGVKVLGAGVGEAGWECQGTYRLRVSKLLCALARVYTQEQQW